MPGKIFINYRHDDYPDFVDRVRDQFVTIFGRDNVFKDNDSIIGGQEWEKKIRQKIHQSNAFIVIIGPQWLKILKEKGGRGKKDLGSMEIKLALKQNKYIVPVLIKGGTIYPNQLPRDLKNLLKRQIHEIHPDPYFYASCKRIIDEVAKKILLPHEIQNLMFNDGTLHSKIGVDVQEADDRKEIKIILKILARKFNIEEFIRQIAIEAGVMTDEIDIVNIDDGSLVITLTLPSVGFSLLKANWNYSRNKFKQFNLVSIDFDGDLDTENFSDQDEEEKIGKIFISYRQDDQREFVQRIQSRLRDEFGVRNIFFDMDRDWGKAGRSLEDDIKKSILNSNLLLVIIGRRWLDLIQQKAEGSYGLDYVLTEIRIAQEENILIIPVLISDAEMPTRNAINQISPKLSAIDIRTLENLTKLEALYINDNPTFAVDVDTLVSRIRQFAGFKGDRNTSVMEAILEILKSVAPSSLTRDEIATYLNRNDQKNEDLEKLENLVNSGQIAKVNDRYRYIKIT